MLCLLSGPLGFNYLISFALVFSCMYCWVLIFFLTPYSYLDLYVLGEDSWISQDLSCEPNIYVSWSREAISHTVSFLLTVPRQYLVLDLFIVCLSLLIMFCLCHVALWSPVWKERTFFALLYAMFSCVFVSFPHDILGQLWYLLVSIPDLCLLPYF